MMSDLKNTISTLPDAAAIAALDAATKRYLQLSGVAIPQLAAITQALFEIEAPEGVTALDRSTREEKGELARQALTQMAVSDDRRAVRVAEIAIRECITTAQAEPVTIIIIVGSFLLGLAVVSKITYDSKKGVGLKPGFPGLAEVLDKAAKLVSAAIGAGDEGGASA
jgi:hypothetical protein